MSKPVIKIEQWGTVRDDSDPYKAPEIRPMYLTGHIPNHPARGEIKQATTTRIVKLDIAGKQIETRNSIYELGEAHPDFIKVVKPGTKLHEEMIAGGFINEVKD